MEALESIKAWNKTIYGQSLPEGKQKDACTTAEAIRYKAIQLTGMEGTLIAALDALQEGLENGSNIQAIDFITVAKVVRDELDTVGGEMEQLAKDIADI